MVTPWRCGEALEDEAFAVLLRRAVFDCCKWHTHVEDRPVLTPYPLVLSPATWQEVSDLALRLDAEAHRAEAELLNRPELVADLGLTGELRTALGDMARRGATPGRPRITRFDFHWTTEGWRISESNADVCGGLIESSGLTALVAAHHPALRPAGDPAGMLAAAIAAATGPGQPVALMHETMYTEDRQVLLYLARRLAEQGVDSWPCAGEQVKWVDGVARVQSSTFCGEVGLVYRFYPAHWLPDLADWRAYFAGGRTAVCNPGWAVLTQSKRFPLTWDRLREQVPTWRALLPETRSPRGHDWRDPAWVIKPALGFEGVNVGVPGATLEKDWADLRRLATRDPASWVVQRRFEPVPLATPEGPGYPSLGVYVIDGHCAGLYARVAPRPLIDDRSREMTVLVNV
jgi:glutathionylspermidine synthase